VRLLFASYALDVLDGVIARARGESSREGLMLDRAIDRLSQVIAPLVIYASWLSQSGSLGLVDAALLTVYGSIIVPVAFYRLVYRVVWSLNYFHGLPLFVHAGLLLTSIISGSPVNPAVLVIAALMSALPVKYFRTSRRGRPSPLAAPRLALVLSLALLPYDNALVAGAAQAVNWLLIGYIAAGPLAFYAVSRSLGGPAR
jgi:CDP-diacylglycerol--serine O-phosphatidyltransferase